ncbi:glycine betaine ABC transporter substrate-binding protein [Virgibacillus sp. CBA3643]|uniref:glycine betaine ABC transporter substrate-binding protein n=1 Tax=Virgibacillus sp. CBA3643 TaxID=2942278 RepID=UPI0035A2FE97
MFSTKKIKWVLPILIGMLILSACSTGNENEASNSDDTAGEDKGEIELTLVNWATEIASTNVISLVLQEAGYDTVLTPVDLSPMWLGVAQGDVDGFVAGWLPTDMKNEYEEYGDDVVDLGPNMEGNKTGLAVPDYVDVTSIEEVNSDNFDEIIGIDAGSGLNQATEDMIEEYDTDIDLVDSSDAAMMATLGDAINNEEPIVFTAWQPHWMFEAYDIRFLDDPKGVYEEDGSIHTMVREGLEEDEPEAYQILDNFYWESDDMNSVMIDIEQNDMEPEEAAQKWIDNNRDKVDEWLDVDSE